MKTRALPLLLAVVGLTALVAVTACGTVTPAIVAAKQPSYDGNEQTSGVLAQLPEGIVVTNHLRLRYNALIATYGRDFTPELTRDDGMLERPDGSWLVDRGHFVQFLDMVAWQRSGLKPVNP